MKFSPAAQMPRLVMMWAVALVFASAPGLVNAQYSTYYAVDLGSLGGRDTFAYGINNAGTVVGDSLTGVAGSTFVAMS
jgi:hypothetical protein